MSSNPTQTASTDLAARWALPALRPSTVPMPPELAARREAAAAITATSPVAEVEIVHRDYGGVACVVSEPPDPAGVFAYFHGGGYRQGSAAMFTPFAARLAHATGARVVAVDYRLAPEDPFPAALYDAVSAYEALLAKSEHTPIAIGDSAGGGLAAALVAACIRADVTIPARLVLASAWLDLRCTAETYTSRAGTDQLFSHEAASEAARLYLQGHDADDPLGSPLLTDVTSFPPTLLTASADEVLLDDTLAMATALAHARVPTTTSIECGVPHAWPSVMSDGQAAAATIELIARFVGTTP